MWDELSGLTVFFPLVTLAGWVVWTLVRGPRDKRFAVGTAVGGVTLLFAAVVLLAVGI